MRIENKISGNYTIYKDGKEIRSFQNIILKSGMGALLGDDYCRGELRLSIDVAADINFNMTNFAHVKLLQANNDILDLYNKEHFSVSEDAEYYYLDTSYAFRYADFENLGNFTAVSFWPISASKVKDENGQFATFSKLESEVLDIIYTIRNAVKKTSMMFDGVKCDLKIKLPIDALKNNLYNNMLLGNAKYLLSIRGIGMTFVDGQKEEICTIQSLSDLRYIGDTMFNSNSANFKYSTNSRSETEAAVTRKSNTICKLSYASVLNRLDDSNPKKYGGTQVFIKKIILNLAERTSLNNDPLDVYFEVPDSSLINITNKDFTVAFDTTISLSFNE